MQNSFYLLEKKFTTLLVLAFPDFDTPFRVEKASYANSIGAVLTINRTVKSIQSIM